MNNIEKSLKNNENKLQRFILDLECKIIEGLTYREIFNINTVEDYENLEAK